YQLPHLFALRIVQIPRGKADDTASAFLSAQLLALHEVEQGHQCARDLWVERRIGRLEYDGQQAAYETGEGRCRLDLSCAEIPDPLAQAGQFFKAIEQVRDPVEQPGPIGRLIGIGLESVQTASDVGLKGA